MYNVALNFKRKNIIIEGLSLSLSKFDDKDQFTLICDKNNETVKDLINTFLTVKETPDENEILMMDRVSFLFDRITENNGEGGCIPITIELIKYYDFDGENVAIVFDKGNHIATKLEMLEAKEMEEEAQAGKVCKSKESISWQKLNSDKFGIFHIPMEYGKGVSEEDWKTMYNQEFDGPYKNKNYSVSNLFNNAGINAGMAGKEKHSNIGSILNTDCDS